MISPTNRAVCWKQSSLIVPAEPSGAFPTTGPYLKPSQNPSRSHQSSPQTLAKTPPGGLTACRPALAQPRTFDRHPKAYCWGSYCRERKENLEHVQCTILHISSTYSWMLNDVVEWCTNVLSFYVLFFVHRLCSPRLALRRPPSSKAAPGIGIHLSSSVGNRGDSTGNFGNLSSVRISGVHKIVEFMPFLFDYLWYSPNYRLPVQRFCGW